MRKEGIAQIFAFLVTIGSLAAWAGLPTTEPGGDAHFARTGDELAVIYITGVGPTDTHYLEKSADPRH